MNTLNNIHALIELNHDMAQKAVLKLSKMMRYLLYESGKGTTTLLKEIEFLKSYVELMQLRIDKSVVVSFHVPETVSETVLPPLLFICFIENAFKHGVSYREPSNLSFSVEQTGNTIKFTAVNTIASQSTAEALFPGGIGLQNIRKRLDLLYGNAYILDIQKTELLFNVTLIIPV